MNGLSEMHRHNHMLEILIPHRLDHGRRFLIVGLQHQVGSFDHFQHFAQEAHIESHSQLNTFDVGFNNRLVKTGLFRLARDLHPAGLQLPAGGDLNASDGDPSRAKISACLQAFKKAAVVITVRVWLDRGITWVRSG